MVGQRSKQMLFVLNNSRDTTFFSYRTLLNISIYLYIYVYIYHIFCLFRWGSVYCIASPLSLLFFTWIGLLSGDIPVFHLKSFRFVSSLSVDERSWPFKMAFTSGYGFKTKEQNVCFSSHKHFTKDKKQIQGACQSSFSDFACFSEAWHWWISL